MPTSSRRNLASASSSIRFHWFIDTGAAILRISRAAWVQSLHYNISKLFPHYFFTSIVLLMVPHKRGKFWSFHVQVI
jgi:hypothetical protein